MQYFTIQNSTYPFSETQNFLDLKICETNLIKHLHTFSDLNHFISSHYFINILLFFFFFNEICMQSRFESSRLYPQGENWIQRVNELELRTLNANLKSLVHSVGTHVCHLILG